MHRKGRTDLENAIYYLKRFHRSLRKQVNFDTYNRNHAIYLLLGGLLTAGISSIKHLEEGDLAASGQQDRIIIESIDLLIFFMEQEDDSRQIKAWFNGHIVERRSGNKGTLNLKERSKKYGIDITSIQNIDMLNKGWVNIFSSFMHPSYDLVNKNYDQTKKTFDYSKRFLSKLSKEEFLYLAGFSITHVIFGFLFTHNVLEITDKDFSILSNYYRLLRVKDPKK